MTNKIFKRLIILAAFIAPIQLYAARIDTLSVKSEKMNKEIEVVVIVPDKAINHQECPTLYLLHGYSGNARTWINIKPELPDMADKDGIIVVCRTVKTAGTGIAPLIRTASSRLLYRKNW